MERRKQKKYSISKKNEKEENMQFYRQIEPHAEETKGHYENPHVKLKRAHSSCEMQQRMSNERLKMLEAIKDRKESLYPSSTITLEDETINNRAPRLQKRKTFREKSCCIQENESIKNRAPKQQKCKTFRDKSCGIRENKSINKRAPRQQKRKTFRDKSCCIQENESINNRASWQQKRKTFRDKSCCIQENESINNTAPRQEILKTFRNESCCTQEDEAINNRASRQQNIKTFSYLANCIQEKESFNNMVPRQEKLKTFINESCCTQEDETINNRASGQQVIKTFSDISCCIQENESINNTVPRQEKLKTFINESCCTQEDEAINNRASRQQNIKIFRDESCCTQDIIDGRLRAEIAKDPITHSTTTYPHTGSLENSKIRPHHWAFFTRKSVALKNDKPLARKWRLADAVMHPKPHQLPLPLIFHVVLLATATIYVLTVVPKNLHLLSAVLKNTFINCETHVGNSNTFKFLTISLDHQVWDYLSTTLVPALDQYQNTSELAVLETSHILGSPRIRSIVVAEGTCMIPSEFKESFEECFGPYNEANEVESGEIKEMGKYDLSIGGLPYVGKIATYRSSGYVQELTHDKEVNFEIISLLRNDGWFSGGARALLVEFTVYNPSANLFGIIKLAFERASTGAIQTSYNIRVFHLYGYVTEQTSWTIRTLNILIITFLGLKMFYIFYYLYRDGLDFFLSCYRLLDLIILVLVFIHIDYCKSLRIMIAAKFHFEDSDYDNYYEFDEIAQLYHIIMDIMAVIIFAIWIKTLKYCTCTPMLVQLFTSLKKSTREVIECLLVFLGLFIRFVLFAQCLFGLYASDFETISKTVFTLSKALWGDYGYSAIMETSPHFAVPLICTLVFANFIIIVCTTNAIVAHYIFVEIMLKHKEPKYWTFKKFYYKYIHRNKRTTKCNTSVLVRAGFHRARIPILLEKYGLQACDKANLHVIRRIIRDETKSLWKDHNELYSVQHEIVELDLHVKNIETYIQFSVCKAEEYIVKLEMVAESYAELLTQKRDSDT